MPDYAGLSVQEAVALQQRLRQQVVCDDRFEAVHCVAGVDVSVERQGDLGHAAVVVLHLLDMQVEEQVVVSAPVRFPYVPGLLGFREVPIVLEALNRLQRLPDVLLCDGQGTAHPRRFGLACHLGLLADIPSIGVAKSRLCGHHAPVADERGAWVPLYDGAEVIGAVLRSRPGTKPLYVSPGHRVSLRSAIELVLRCVTHYRLPEPTRLAHQLISTGMGKNVTEPSTPHQATLWDWNDGSNVPQE
ncbi:MAG: deoxyribonuclease V [Ardenticatenia bacterium]|nr:MAG: deoxyribonuclease V [Ardenticatenia bacterium]